MSAQPTTSASGAPTGGLLDQAKTLAAQTVEQVTALANQAANSQAAASVTEGAKTLATQTAAAASTAASTAASLAGQAHAQAHATLPNIVPPPAGGSVDTRGDLSPTNETDRAKLDKLFGERADAKELKDKGILKGDPNDALAGKRAELQRSMMENKLDKEIAQRPSPEDLVKKGILNPDEAPPSK